MTNALKLADLLRAEEAKEVLADWYEPRVRWASSTALTVTERHETHHDRMAFLVGPGFCLCWRCKVDDTWGGKLMERWRQLLPIMALGFRLAPVEALDRMRAVHALLDLNR